jgi:hypothetical protein
MGGDDEWVLSVNGPVHHQRRNRLVTDTQCYSVSRGQVLSRIMLEQWHIAWEYGYPKGTRTYPTVPVKLKTQYFEYILECNLFT